MKKILFSVILGFATNGMAAPVVVMARPVIVARPVYVAPARAPATPPAAPKSTTIVTPSSRLSVAKGASRAYYEDSNTRIITTTPLIINQYSGVASEDCDTKSKDAVKRKDKCK